MKTRFYIFSDKGRIKRYKKENQVPKNYIGRMVIESINKLNSKQDIHFFTSNFGKPLQVWIANSPDPSNKSLIIAKSFLKMKGQI